MELRQLRYFVAVAEELHFARAAARVGIEQSPLSKAIKDFEAELGVSLFARTRRSTRLLYAGEVLLNDARRILAAAEGAGRSLQEIAAGRKGRLTVGLSEGMFHPRLSALLAAWRYSQTDIEIRVLEFPLGQQLNELYAGSIDVGFSLAPVKENGIQAETLWTDPVVVALTTHHPLAQRAKLNFTEIAREPLILHRSYIRGFETQLDALSRTTNERPRVVTHAAGLSLLLTLVSARAGVALLSAGQAQIIARSDIAIRPLAAPAPQLTTYLLRRSTSSSGLIDQFCAHARRFAATQSVSP